MAVTWTSVKALGPTRGLRTGIWELTGDASYGAGGYAVAAGDFAVGYNHVISINPHGAMGSAGSGGTGLVPQWDRANSKLKLWKGAGSAALTEAAAGDPNGLKLIVSVIAD